MRSASGSLSNQVSVGPQISVVIAAHNAERFIEATLQSILNQGFESLEVVVVDDGSSDNTTSVVESVNDPRIKLIKSANFGGPARPRNIGLEASRGQLVFLFDSDDIMLPGKLAVSAQLLNQNPEAAFLFTNFESINELGVVNTQNYLADYDTLYSLPHEDIGNNARMIKGQHVLAGLAKANFIGTSSVAIKRHAIKQVGEFDERLRNGDDFRYWTKLASEFNAVYVDQPLHQYRIHTQSISRANPTRFLENQLLLLEICQNDLALPVNLRRSMKRQRRDVAYDLIKTYLKSDNQLAARRTAVKLLQLDFFSWKSHLLAVLSFAPRGLRRQLIETYRVTKQ